MRAVFNWLTVGVSVGVLVLLTVANEIGFRSGRAFGKDEPESSRAVANGIKASIIGLVAFLLGFAFSISSGRHDIRRQMVLDEANAFGTLHLRAGLLMSPERERLRTAIGHCVAKRLELFERNLDEDIERQKAMDAGLAEIWATIEAANEKAPQSVLVSQVIPAANAVIDLNTSRAWAFRSHTPPAVLGVLMVCVLVSAGLIGHSFGQYHHRHLSLCLSFNLLFALTLYLILDYDGPRFGVIRVDHTPLIQFRDSLGGTDGGL